MEESRREKYMENILNLSINSGKVNEYAKSILYSDDNIEMKKQKIQETKNELSKIVENIKNIADSLEIKIDEII